MTCPGWGWDCSSCHCPLLSAELNRSAVSDSLQSHGLQPARLFCPWDFPGKNTGVGCHPFPGDLPDPGIKPTSPALAGRFFTTAPPGKHVTASLFGVVNVMYVYMHEEKDLRCKQFLPLGRFLFPLFLKSSLYCLTSQPSAANIYRAPTLWQALFCSLRRSQLS